MHIESPETFRLWLASELAPLSDANPESLAKYVHALVKKDKPIDELKDLMIDQLDVFLLGETKTFVQLIFKNLESKEYLSFKKEPEKEDKKEEPSSSVEADALTEEPVKPTTDIGVTSTEEKVTTIIQSSVVSEGTVKEDPKKDEKKKEGEERFRLNRSRLKRDARSRSRSRSRSWERARRSRSRERIDRERERERDRRVPAYRNKSPPRRYERRRSYGSRSPSPGRYRTGSRSRSRSPKFTGRNRYRNRSPGRSRSRSPSPQTNSGGKEDGAGDRHGVSSRRCRDFDVKGFCMRGEFCPYDHGTDPVVVPPTLPFGVAGTIVAGGPPMVVPPPGIIPPNGPPPHLPPPGMMMRPPPNMEYSPDAPALTPGMSWNRPLYHGPRHPVPPFGYHPHQRDLISVRVDAHGQPQDGRHLERKGSNCCLDIKKIPVGLNNITHLNNHFAKFGKIVNIQVNYKNDPEAAMITFSSPAEAHAAFKSTEAVLNNRFIKVFWHYDSKDARNGNVKERLGPANNHKQANNENVAVNAGAMTFVKKPDKSSDEQKAKALAQLKNNQEIVEKNQLIRKKTEDNRKEVIELNTELRKRSQNLLEKHIQEQKELLKKLESGGLDEKQRGAVKDAIKALQETIEKVKNDLLMPVKKSTPVKRSKDEIQKEILDMELDIISTQQEGGDLVALYKKLAALKTELQKVAPFRPARPTVAPSTLIKHPAYSSHSLRKNNTAYKSTVDHRPTKLLVSGYENDEKDLVLAHFREYGEIADYIADDSTPSIVLNFKTRNEAEMAMNQGKNFQDRLLTVTWFATPHMPTRRRNSSASGGGTSYHMHAGRQVLLSNDEDNLGSKSPELDDTDLERALESGEEFLLQDDDEDGDDEERSWRR